MSYFLDIKNIYFIASGLCWCILLTADVKSQTFNNNLQGVMFSPYVKGREISRSSYTMEEVKTMLKIVSKHFRILVDYNYGEDALVSKAAAQLNRDSTIKKMKLKNDDDSFDFDVYSRILIKDRNFNETRKAIKTTLKQSFSVNEIYPNTVRRLVTMHETVVIPENVGNSRINRELEESLTSLIELRKQMNESAQHFEIGTRLYDCGRIFVPTFADIIVDIVNKSDFVLCNFFPTRAMKEIPLEEIVEKFVEHMQKVRSEFWKYNKRLEVIVGETGWPSEGWAPGEIPPSDINLSLYWTSLSQLLGKEQIKVFFFEAFDQSWRCDVSIRDPNSYKGRYGAFCFYGLWRLNSEKNTDLKNVKSELFVSKYTEAVNVGVVIGSVFGAVFIILAIVVAWLYHYVIRIKKFTNTLSDYDIKEFFDGRKQSRVSGNKDDYALLLPYNEDMEIPGHKMTIFKEELLGSGAFGLVYKGKIGGVDGFVAFKTVRSDAGASPLRDLLAEIKIMSYIGCHENIVGLVGAYTQELREGKAYLAVEFCGNGSLQNRLRKYSATSHYQKRDSVLPEKINISETFEEARYINTFQPLPNCKRIELDDLIKWSYQISNGMSYLASKKVIHADLATRNVLLTDKEDAKITDFGLSRRLYEYTNYMKQKQEPLPWRWMSIEALRDLTFSTQSDVWSYGVTLWEIFSHGDIPYPGLNWNLQFLGQLEHGLRLKQPPHADDDVYNAMMMCWNNDPKKRPSFDYFSDFFKRMLQNRKTAFEK